jgi:hypothetical protein
MCVYFQALRESISGAAEKYVHTLTPLQLTAETLFILPRKKQNSGRPCTVVGTIIIARVK